MLPLIFGGGQEYRKRSGTENVAAIVGFAKALKKVHALRDEETKRLLPLRDALIDGILKLIPDSRLNGDRTKRLPNNVNVSFKGIEGEAILLQLDMLGVAASSGSACTSGSSNPLTSSVPWVSGTNGPTPPPRFTLGHGNTQHQVDYLLEKLPAIIRLLRRPPALRLENSN